MKTSTLIEARNLVKDFGPKRAVDGVSLEIAAGEIYALVGPSGSGKTTIVRMANGLESPTAGNLEVFGRPVPDGFRGIAHRIGYMPQEVALYRDLTVRENLEFFGGLYGLEGRPLRAKIDELLEFMDMARRGRQTVETLSGVELRRTSLACALNRLPPLYATTDVGAQYQRERARHELRSLVAEQVTV